MWCAARRCAFIRSSPSTNAAIASMDRCSVEPNWRGAPTGASLWEANCAGSQENARRNTCPRSAITNSLRSHPYVECSSTEPDSCRISGKNPGLWVQLVKQAVIGRRNVPTQAITAIELSRFGVWQVLIVFGMRGQVVAQRLTAAVYPTAHGAQL